MGKLRLREGCMNEEMDSNLRCKSDPTVVAMSKGNNSEWLSTTRGALTTGKGEVSSDTTREHVVSLGELLHIHHCPSCNAPPQCIFSDSLGRAQLSPAPFACSDHEAEGQCLPLFPLPTEGQPELKHPSLGSQCHPAWGTAPKAFVE